MTKSIKDTSETQLDRVLSFFPRVEAKASFLFALNTGMLALLALNLRLDDFLIWFLVIPAISFILLIGAESFFPLSLKLPFVEGRH